MSNVGLCMGIKVKFSFILYIVYVN